MLCHVVFLFTLRCFLDADDGAMEDADGSEMHADAAADLFEFFLPALVRGVADEALAAGAELLEDAAAELLEAAFPALVRGVSDEAFAASDAFLLTDLCFGIASSAAF